MKAYKYKLKPSAKIVAVFESWLAVLCELYNAAFQERRGAYQINHLSISRFDQDRQLPDIKKVEDLNIQGMVKNHHLAKSISDAGWGQFIMIVIHKAEEAGRTVVKVNPSYTSQDCSRCGYRNLIRLGTRIYRCTRCDLVIHRDRNAAKQIEQRGRAVPSGSRRGVACEEPRTYQATDLESPAITR